MSEWAGPGGIWGEDALELSRQLFEEWHEYRQSEGKMSLQELKEAVGPIRTDFKQKGMGTRTRRLGVYAGN